jgi:RNA polymerase sigma-70 factor (ECF subfamily)
MVSHIGSYRDMGYPLSAWLYRIARNCVLDHLAKEDSDRASALEQAEIRLPQGNNPAQIVEEQHEGQQILMALRLLEEMEREVVILRFLAGFSLKEVAESLDRSVSAVKAIQYRGLNRLRSLATRG